MRSQKAFTLVELIVVITILSILGMISFLSFSGYSSNARDSVRITDLDNITKSLELTLIRSGTLPKPENSMAIKNGSMVTGYQGYINKTMFGIINMSEAKDPLDGVYYTIGVDINQKKYQILGFLENADSLGYSPVDQAYAEPATYSGRTLMTKGNQLGVLLQANNLLPVQVNYDIGSFTGIDIMSTNSGYVYQFDKNIQTTGTGSDLSYAWLTYGVSSNGLVGYWPMDEGTGAIITKDVASGNFGSLNAMTGTILPQWINGKVGNALLFNGKNVVHVGDVKAAKVRNSLTTIAWFNWNADSISATPCLFSYEGGYEICPMKSNPYYLTFAVGNQTPGWNYINTNISTVLNTWQQVGLVYNFESGNIKAYLNGVSLFSTGAIGPITYTLSEGKGFDIGHRDYYRFSGTTTYGFSGAIDDVRVYNRVLSDAEMVSIYNATK